MINLKVERSPTMLKKNSTVEISEPYRILMEFGMELNGSLENVLTRGHFDEIHPWVKEHRFPHSLNYIPGRGSLKLYEVCFNKQLNICEVWDGLLSLRLLPADLFHIVSFGAQYPEWESPEYPEDGFLALGSRHVYCGREFAPIYSCKALGSRAISVLYVFDGRKYVRYGSRQKFAAIG